MKVTFTIVMHDGGWVVKGSDGSFYSDLDRKAYHKREYAENHKKSLEESVNEGTYEYFRKTR
jgi:hypothetical protein